MWPTTGILLALLVVCCQPLGSWSRYISLSMNLSMSFSDNEDDDRHMLSAEMVRACLKSTELSMLELNHFRLSLLSEQLLNSASTRAPRTGGLEETLPEPELDANVEPTSLRQEDENENEDDGGGDIGEGNPEGDPEGKNLEYDGNNAYNSDYDTLPSFASINSKDQSPEPIQCFVHCLYEQMGLIKDDNLVEESFFRRLYSLYDRDQKISMECMHFESNNKCESAYKMHLCYNRLKSWDAERRLEEVLNLTDLNDTAGVEQQLKEIEEEEEEENEMEPNQMDNEIEST